ncbi:ATP-binding protein [Microbacterium sp.]|uniref:ATP-binding protein n=1 Tax=Microbacterium sp. TaxID=51671 RepID=UPI0025D750C2|nr:ATP-binding protein [Microbacterium sp.]
MEDRSDSPFRAGFGKTPPVLVGRDDLIVDFGAAIDVGAWGQERVTLIEGLRGVGKTVMVNALEDVARERGWFVVSETATPGFAERITSTHLPRILSVLDPPPARRITGAGVAGATITTTLVDHPQPTPTLRSQLADFSELAGGRGILITLDEISLAARDDLSFFVAELQHSIRQDREVAFVGAGLGSSISELLGARSLTFLRRASRQTLDFLDYDDVLRALGKPITDAGRVIGDEALAYAAAATQGYPFLAQLIGDLAWRAHPGNQEISLDDVQNAYRRARRTMGSHILEPSLRDLSNTDRTVLAAMAAVDGPSKVSDLRVTLGVNARYMGVYRQRLLDAGVIYAVKHGVVDIALPYLREYLRDHVVTDATTESARRRLAFPAPPSLPTQGETE